MGQTNSRFALIAALGTSLVAVSASRAGVVATRPQLVAMLGANAQTEDFESFHVAFANGFVLNSSVLDSSTNLYGQTGLVRPDVAFRTSATYLSWNGDNFFQHTETLSPIWSDSSELSVDLLDEAFAFGMDVASEPLTMPVTLDVYAADDTTLLASIPDIYPDPVTRTFVGYASAVPIGKAVILQQVKDPQQFFTIDNFTYGVPEPTGASLLLLTGAACATRRAR